MIHEDNHFVVILALQLPPPAQRALAGELFVAPDQPGRLGGRRVEWRQATRGMRARRGCGLGHAVDLTSLRINDLVNDLGDLVIRRGHPCASLGLIPQAIGLVGDGQHQHHKRQAAVNTRLGLLRSRNGSAARTACWCETSRSRSNCGRRSRSTTAHGSC